MITIYFDGLCESAYLGGPRNPGGVATYGYVIYQNGNTIKRGYRAIGEGAGMTNNVAEFGALKRALEWFDEQGIEDEIVIKGDSMLVINQIKGIWQVRSQTSRKYVPEIKRLLRGKRVRLEWVKRENNAEADSLSRIAYRNYMNEKMERRKGNK
ncbi:MAG TPA: ribonuclease HI family protein [Thermoplasmata archaeon]|nr:ribonuclease HI family protein [Thermoplasmata archaeon]